MKYEICLSGLFLLTTTLTAFCSNAQEVLLPCDEMEKYSCANAR